VYNFPYFTAGQADTKIPINWAKNLIEQLWAVNKEDKNLIILCILTLGNLKSGELKRNLEDKLTMDGTYIIRRQFIM